MYLEMNAAWGFNSGLDNDMNTAQAYEVCVIPLLSPQ